jgi:hypothetical protein
MSELPYEIDAKHDLFAVLESPHEIPYHSRPFMWTRENYIEHIVRQAIDKYRNGKQHWLGFLIVYYGGPQPSITDAQHRLTVYFLLFLVCCRILGKEKRHLGRISKYGHDELLDDSVTDADAAILEEYGWQHIPNIRSVYTHDFEALGNVLNGIYLTDTSASRIYDAYTTVYDLLSNPGVMPTEDLGPFLSHIMKTTKVSRVRITDWEFTLEVFDVLNNIKVTVPPIYLLKNTFVRQGGKATSEAIHTAFQRWEQAIGRGAAFDQFVHVMTNLFVGSWNKQDKYVHALTNYLAERKCGFSTFNEFIERGLTARAWMQSNRCSAMISALAAGHEVIDFCVLPLLTLADSPAQVTPFLWRLLAYGLRLPGRFSFNQLARCELLIGKDGIITALAAGRMSIKDAIKSLDQLLLGWLGEEAGFAARVASDSYKSGATFNKARVALLYIAEMTDKHEATLDHSLIDIDHVSPKNPRKGDLPLQNGELLHCIGNFTPFIGKNSATLRGNRGFGNKPYAEKRDSYAASNIAMTRTIASRYATFADVEIQERSRELAIQLDELTKKALFNTTL